MLAAGITPEQTTTVFNANASSSVKRNLSAIVLNRQFTPEVRTRATEAVYQYMCTNARSIDRGNFSNLCSSDLGLLFQINDEYFFEGEVAKLCERTAHRPLSFRLSTRMTSAGGMTTMQTSKIRRKRQVDFEIAIATTPLFASFRDEENAIVSGINCNDRLEALQRIMEHEMVHLIEMLLWTDSNCSANPFKNIVRRFFGHTESKHQLLTPRDLAKKKLGISPGDKVQFHADGLIVQGHVNRITKRATVLVPHARGQRYDDGKKYKKYYVPLNRLRRAS
ncbi:MAG: hypothetical protein ACKVHR_04305 [Pirellulales bacterium]